ncbi:MAG: HepT-like ribonuclease domain-containing protein [Candidatus Helarchaeota archaeon]
MKNSNFPKKLRRLQKYDRKINHFINSFKRIMNWSENFNIDILIENEIKRYAIYKLYQECIESIFDIVSMVVKDLKLRVEDDYSNLEQLKMNNILNEKEINILKKGNHLRNLIIHWYNKISEEEILKDIKSIIYNLNDIVLRFKKWIDQFY